MISIQRINELEKTSQDPTILALIQRLKFTRSKNAAWCGSTVKATERANVLELAIRDHKRQTEKLAKSLELPIEDVASQADLTLWGEL